MTMMYLQLTAQAFLTHSTPWHTPNVKASIEDWHLEWILLPLQQIAIHIPMRLTVKAKQHAKEKKKILHLNDSVHCQNLTGIQVFCMNSVISQIITVYIKTFANFPK